MATITGTAGNDTLDGTTAADVITGLNGVDVIHGGNGNDVIDGGVGNDTLYGDNQSDTLEGGAGHDALYGGAGNDTLSGGAGNDTLDGGPDLNHYGDTASYATAINLVKVNLTLQGVEQNTVGGGLDTLINIGSLIGSDFNDTLTGNDDSNRLTGGLGNDILIAGGGDDFLVGGAGNDTIDGGAGHDRVLYSDATSAVTVDLRIQGVAQNTGGGGSDTLTGIEGVTGSAFDDTLTGTTGADTFYGSGGADVLVGGEGDDFLNGGYGDDVVDGGAGSDTVDLYTTFTNPPNLTLDLRIQGVAQNTGAGLTTLISIENANGGFGNDTIIGDDNDNVIDGYDGSDTLDGGAGVDTLSFALDQGGEFFWIDLEAGTASGFYFGAVDHISNFENVLGSAEQDSIYGNAGDNVLDSGGGGGNLVGRGGDDVLIASVENDYIDGGEGVDTVSYVRAEGGVQVALFVHGQQSTGGSGMDTLVDIENAVGSSFNDFLIGNDGVNSLAGGAGDDLFSGARGDDVIDGGQGDDAAIYTGNLADYQLTLLDGVVTIIDLRDPTGENHDGVDTLTGIEKLAFADGIFNVADLDLGPPVPGDDELVVTRGIEASLSADVLLANDPVRGDLVVTAVSNIVGAQVALVEGRLVILAAGETASFDYVIGSGEDAITGHATIRTVVATAATDTLTGPPSNAADLHGLGGNDTLTGTDGDDRLFGETGNDVLNGGKGADHLVGGTGNDTFHVDRSGDVVVELADGGRDTVISGVDLTLGDNLEVLILTGDAREGTGNALANTLTGTSGDDILDGGAGADVMTGGLGSDIYYVDNAGDRVTELTNGGFDNVYTSLNQYTLSANVERLVFTGTGDFTGIGNTLGNDIVGGLGDDRLDGGVGAALDTLRGGGGDDTYVVRHANRMIYEFTDQGYDRVETSVTFWLDISNPHMQSIEELVATGTANIDLHGNSVTTRLIGNDGNNGLWAFAAGAYLAGGKGNDTYYGGFTLVELEGEGYDTVVAGNYTLLDNFEKLIISPNQSLALSGTGNGADNVIIGNQYNNVIDGKAGADTMEGGLGDDTYHVDNTGDVVKETGVGVDTVISSVDFTLGAFVEHLTFTGSAGRTGKGNTLANHITGTVGGDILIGDAGNDWLLGNGGDDVLDGGIGDDWLNGGGGADHMTGGLGIDQYDVDNVGDVVIEAANGGILDIVVTRISDYTLAANVERLSADWTVAGAAYGNSLNNNMGVWKLVGGALYGMGGDDFLYGIAGGAALLLDGGDGNDLLRSGSGLDTLVGGAGNDTFEVIGGETIIELAEEGTDTILLSSAGAYVMAANVENLTWTSLTGGATVTGNASNNIIRGYTLVGTSNYGNVLDGGEGNDTLYGSNGNDHLIGGSGTDKLYGYGGLDTLEGGAGNDSYYGVGYNIIEAADGGVDTLYLSNYANDYYLADNVENVTYTGPDITYYLTNLWGNASNNIMRGGNGDDSMWGMEGNDSLYGGAGVDTLVGMEGNDTLYGGAGDDTLSGWGGADKLEGGGGRDWMHGGEGADQFIYLAISDSVAGAARDVITDFDTSDLINLKAIDADVLTSGDQAFLFVGTAVFSHTAGELRYVQSGGDTIIQGDIDGDGVADFEVQLLGNVAVNAGDFLL